METKKFQKEDMAGGVTSSQTQNSVRNQDGDNDLFIVEQSDQALEDDDADTEDQFSGDDEELEDDNSIDNINDAGESEEGEEDGITDDEDHSIDEDVEESDGK